VKQANSVRLAPIDLAGDVLVDEALNSLGARTHWSLWAGQQAGFFQAQRHGGVNVIMLATTASAILNSILKVPKLSAASKAIEMTTLVSQQ
jgi:hypothetical protein